MATLELHIVLRGTPAILKEVDGYIRDYIDDLCSHPLSIAEFEIAGGLVKEGCDGKEEPASVSDGE